MQPRFFAAVPGASVHRIPRRGSATGSTRSSDSSTSVSGLPGRWTSAWTKLPNDPRKVTHYLLDLRHPDGGPKAAYFMRFGFREDDPEPLMEALLEHGRSNEVVRLQKTAFGTNYSVARAA